MEKRKKNKTRSAALMLNKNTHREKNIHQEDEELLRSGSLLANITQPELLPD